MPRQILRFAQWNGQPFQGAIDQQIGQAMRQTPASQGQHRPVLGFMRFFGAVWLGLGLCVWWLVPRIAMQTTLFRAAWLMIAIGGLGRLLSMAEVGRPLAPFIGFTALEIVVAPLFIWWQHRVAQDA